MQLLRTLQVQHSPLAFLDQVMTVIIYLTTALLYIDKAFL